jgi:ectoine hydroxylase-related dioxygenase (phytanoyl-CoA dioxygenase family)
MLRLDCKVDPDWLEKCLEGLRYEGCAIVEGVLDEPFVERAKDAMYVVQARIHEDIGEDRLEAAGELGVLRLMVKYDPFFFNLLEVSPVLAVVDATVSETAILHVQNGLVLTSFNEGATPEVFQTRFHRDFPRVLNGSLMSVNTFFALDEFTAETGGTLRPRISARVVHQTCISSIRR